MAMEINSVYNQVYERAYAAQKQETVKKQDRSGKEMPEVVEQKNSAARDGKAKSAADYAKELAKLTPGVEFGVGSALSSAKSGKTLTIHLKLLEKMQNNPAQEKETKELIKGAESAMNLIDSINKANGWTVAYKHSYIDENGKYHSVGYYRNDFMLNMSDKLREERRKNSEKLIEKSKNKAETEDKKTGGEQEKVEQMLLEKLENSENGEIELDDNDMQKVIKAAREQGERRTAEKQGNHVNAAGAKLDLQV